MDPSLNPIMLVVAAIIGLAVGMVIVRVKNKAPPSGQTPEPVEGVLGGSCHPKASCTPEDWPPPQRTGNPQKPDLKKGERVCSKCGMYKVVGVNCAGCGKLEANCNCGGKVGIAVTDPGVPAQKQCNPYFKKSSK